MGLFTGTGLTQAAAPTNSDATVGTGPPVTDATRNASPDQPATQPESRVEVLGDSAYGTGQALADLAKAGHTAVVKPCPLRKAVPGGFSIADFPVDETVATATCPNGLTRPMSPKRTVTFGAGCRGCPLRARCTTSTAGRSLTIHEHASLQRVHRAHAADPDFQAVYRQHRPMVERSLAWLTRGNRRLRYRGTTKNNARLHHRAAAVRLTRLRRLGLNGVIEASTLAPPDQPSAGPDRTNQHTQTPPQRAS